MSPEFVPVDEADIRVALARMEGKLDAALATHAGRLDGHGEKIAGTERDLEKHDERIRALEGRATVSPKQLAAAGFSILAALGTASPFLARLYS